MAEPIVVCDNLVKIYKVADLEVVALQGLDLEVAQGEMLAIVGASGSGKSTIAKLVLGLYKPEMGTVMVDGMDIHSLNLQSMRKQIGIVTQEPHLFSGSIKSNITLGDNSMPFDKVVDAAKRAHFHEEIMKMPLNYDTPLADGGSSLSGGQRQRLALARALINKPAILILDEATSALDAITESKILSELEQLKSTRILIAHRLSTVKNADMIVVIVEGRIEEQGTFNQLITKDGIFSKLVQEQLNKK